MTKPKDPVSTWTNLAYLFAGILMVVSSPSMGTLVLLSGFLGLTIGSMAFHWTRAAWGQKADEIGMYVAFSSLILALLEVHWAIMLMVQGLVLFLAVRLIDKLDSFFLVPALVIISVLVSPMSLLFKLSVVLLYSTSVLIRHLGELEEDAGRFVKYDYAHGIWHIATALAALSTYWFAI